MKATDRIPNYTGSPWQLFVADSRLFWKNVCYLPCIFLPLVPCPSGGLDELYPNTPNLFDITLHSILFIAQSCFLVSLPFLIAIPFYTFVLYIAVFTAVNTIVCRILNRGIPDDGLKSTQDEYTRQWAPHDDEYWIFLNGICVGKHWLQSNIDRLSRTFHRPIVGVHNKTSGVIFDLLQCAIQRSLLFATDDIRDCYVWVKRALYKRGIKKVVLILHSQGGIEGGMMIDWLLNEVPHDLLQGLEVYTFGNLANHFNNPSRGSAVGGGDDDGEFFEGTPERAIAHIEHYANVDDFACRFGVLHFTQGREQEQEQAMGSGRRGERERERERFESRFVGTVFVNPVSGHQLNQHYIDRVLPLDVTRRFTREPEEGDFMNMNAVLRGGRKREVEGQVFGLKAARAVGSPSRGILVDGGGGGGGGSVVVDGEVDGVTGLKIRDLSRLWQYRNGGSPAS